jgi:phospholipid/cholesterol/gamma-HCH transport system substrate-binding protein
MTAIRDRTSQRLSRDRLRLEIRRAFVPFLVVVGFMGLGVASVMLLAARLNIALPWHDRYEVRVAVDDASGVVPGNHEVRISGVVVGKISDVGIERGQAVLTLEVEPEHGPLYRDARLRLRPRTPLEDMYLNVEDRGSAGAGEVPDGGELLAARTQSPVHIREVLDVFDADVRPRMRQTIASLGRGLGGHGADFRAALVELAPFLQSAQRLTREYAVRGRRTRRLVHNFRLITEELARREGQLTRLAAGGGKAFGELGSVDQPLAELITQLPPTLSRLPKSFAKLTATADDLDAAFVALRPAARALPAGLDALNSVAPEIETGAAALRRPLPSLARLVRAARPVAENLDASFSGLLPQAPRLDRVTAALVPCRLTFQKFFHHTISVSQWYDAFGVRPRGQSVLSLKGASAGQVRDVELTHEPDCASGEPRK